MFRLYNVVVAHKKIVLVDTTAAVTLWSSRLSVYNTDLRWFESGCHRKNNDLHEKSKYLFINFICKNKKKYQCDVVV